jgi:hypothetical protein
MATVAHAPRASAAATHVGFYVSGGKLYDANGVEFRIRGVDRTHYDSPSQPGISHSGANAVRMFLFTLGSGMAAKYANVIQTQHIDYDEVPIPTMSIFPDGTTASCNQSTSELASGVAWWVANASTFTPFNRYMMINIANEWGPSNSATWASAYESAIANLRAAGYLGTLVIDAGGCGQDVADLLNYSTAVFNSDPQKNIMFSLHIYGNIPTASVAPDLAKLAALSQSAGMAFVVGEFGPGRDIGPSPTQTTPGQIITAAEANGIGWMGWAWDDNNLGGGASNNNWFSMTLRGPGYYTQASDLTEYGQDMVLNPTYGVSVLAKPATVFGSGVVTPLKSQTITFNAIAGQSAGTNMSLSATASSGLTVSFASGSTSVCTVSGTKATTIAGGTCSIVASQAGNSVYAAAPSVTQKFAVALKSQSISFGAIAGQTSGATLSLSATASSGLAVSFAASPSSVCTISGSKLTTVAAGTCSVVASQSGNSMYAAATSVTQQFAVQALKSQTITFGAIASQSTGASVTLSATASSGLTVSFVATPASVCTISGSKLTTVAAGTCTVVASQSGNSVYAAAPSVTQQFSVAAVLKSQTITFGAIASQSVGVSVALSATASSGLAVSYAASPASVCTVSGGTVTTVAAGTCAVVASQSGNSVYAGAPSVMQQFSVVLKSQSITFNAIGGQTVATSLTLSASASSGLAVSYAASPASVCTISGTKVTTIAAGTCAVVAGQSGNSVYAAAPSVTQKFAVTLKSQTITFGTIASQSVGASVALSAAASSGLAVSYAASPASVCTLSGSKVTAVAAGTCSVVASQGGNSVYAAAPSVTQSFTVTTVSSTSAGQRFVPIAPQRLVDTRRAAGAFGGPALTAGGSRSFVIPSADNSIASTAVAYSLNITVVPSGQLRSLTVYPTGQTQPSVPLLSSDGRIKAQAAIVQAGTGGAITVAASDATNVIIDVNGYFVAASNTTGLTFYPLTPTRLYDTRGTTNSLTAGKTQTFAIQSPAGIPSNAQAYSLNITAIPNPSMSDLVVWAAGQTMPGTSTLNTTTVVTANAAIVAAGTGGAISIDSPYGNADVLIDINGYWAPAGTGGLSLYPVTPTRIFSSGSADVSGLIAIPAPAAVPSTALALLVDATVTPPAAFGYELLWAAGTPEPTASTLNAPDGASTSNTAIVGTTKQSMDMYLQNSTTATVDLYGYFAP